MPVIRINVVATDLNVGIASLKEFLQKKYPNKKYGPNSKLTEEEFRSCLKEFGGHLDKAQIQSLEDKYLAPKKPEATSEPSKGEEQATPPQQSEKTETKKSAGPVVKGKIELDAKGNVIQPKKKATPTAKAEEKKAEPVKPEPKPEPKSEPAKVEKKPAAEEKKPTPKKEEPAKVEQPVAKATKEKPAPQPKVEVKPQPEVEQKPAQPQKKEEKPITPPVAKKQEETTQPEPKKKPAKLEERKTEEPKAEKVKIETPKKEQPKKAEETKEDEPEKTKVFRFGRADDVGLTVVGKVDLSEIEPTRPSKRHRKRVRKGKVDVEEAQREIDGSKDRKARRSGAQPEGKKDQQQKQEKSGRKARRRRKVEEKPEITQEDIQRQIRETMAAIQGGRKKDSSRAAKYRREKRDAHRQEMDALAQEQAKDKTLQLTEYVTANDLAKMIDVPVNDIIMICFNLGIIISINQRLEKDTIDLVLSEYGYEAEYVEAQMIDVIETEKDKEEDLVPRAPIVTVMGHVDHGKTSLLDAIRNEDVVLGEAGGITQHIGAYSVTLDNGKKITFLDTPGHEAFTAMRARGAQVTDVAIIVVAADDGVMPQTKEALSHASLAGVPIIFAINKIDKPQANPDRIKEELANLNYLVEDWGGKYQSQEISAKKGDGIRELLEKVLLEAELMELKANPNKNASGSVVESTLEQGRGYTTKVLVREGTLRTGDYILAGSNYGRVKALYNEYGKEVKEVGPSEPVKVLGLNGATQAGEVFNILDTEAEVREIATKREQLQREQKERTQRLPSLMDINRRIAEGEMQELNIIVKGDMDGSVEALSDSIVKLSTDEINVNVIHKAVGQISESDVILASASNAIIIGFQVRPAQGARRLAEEEGVEIRLYSIIYDALDDITTAMEGMLSPELRERVTASVEVRETFKVSRVGTIAGCYVKEGKISRTDSVRVIRDGIVKHTGKLASLRRFQDDVKEVGAGYECGLNIEGFNDVLVGDQIEAFETIEVKREL
ncbi:MAG: translation initiation factor IF-2 [Porphyromonas sp.]|nr:translation initiation factor IF-2 [Porphyromonas sp.]